MFLSGNVSKLIYYFLSGSNTNGNIETTPSDSTGGGVETTQSMTLEALMKTLRMYMDIFVTFQWTDQIVLLIQILI